jgi:hypothetical protein
MRDYRIARQRFVTEDGMRIADSLCEHDRPGQGAAQNHGLKVPVMSART